MPRPKQRMRGLLESLVVLWIIDKHVMESGLCSRV